MALPPQNTQQGQNGNLQDADFINSDGKPMQFSRIGGDGRRVMVPPRSHSALNWSGDIRPRAYIPRISELRTPPVRIPVEAFLKSRPTSPCFWFLSGDTVYSLPVGALKMRVSVHVSTAIVKLRVVFVNTWKKNIDGIFALPLKGTVTSVEARVGPRRFLQTEVLDNADVADLLRSKQQDIPTNGLRDRGSQNTIPMQNIHEYVPDLFRLPIFGIAARETITIDVDFIEPLVCVRGAYKFDFDLRFGLGILPTNIPPEETVIDISGEVISLAEGVSISSTTHALAVVERPYRKDFRAILTNLVPPVDSPTATRLSALPAFDHQRLSSQGLPGAGRDRPTAPVNHAVTINGINSGNYQPNYPPNQPDRRNSLTKPQNLFDIQSEVAVDIATETGRDSIIRRAQGVEAKEGRDKAGEGLDALGSIDSGLSSLNNAFLDPSTVNFPIDSFLENFNLTIEMPSNDVRGAILRRVDMIDQAPVPNKLLYGSGDTSSEESKSEGSDSGRYSSSSNMTMNASEGESTVVTREHGTFVGFIAPPAQENVEKHFRRNIVFLIDRSGSMVGAPFKHAVEGLEQALLSLTGQDKFNIMCFDHDMIALHKEMIPVTVKNVELAIRWVSEKRPTQGGTALDKPLEWAFQLLSTVKKGLNFIFLLTDGAVANERDICHMAANKSIAGSARVLTFGIGMYCNWYFLRMLSTLTRGSTSCVLYQEKIKEGVASLLATAERPVLADIELEMQGVLSVQSYPFPIPDLFLGTPLTIAGRYIAHNTLPQQITLLGTNGSGQVRTYTLPVGEDPAVPVDKVFLKQQLDLLVAKAWLEDNVELKQEVIDLSVESNIPTPYTTLIAYEAPPEERARKDREEEESKGNRKKGSGLDGVDVDGKRESMGVKPKKTSNEKKAAIIAGGIGVVLAVGVVLNTFGDIGATASNTFGEAASNGFISSLTEGGCDCGSGGCDCGSCDIDCDACC